MESQTTKTVVRARSARRGRSRSRSRSRSRAKTPVKQVTATTVKHVQFHSGRKVADANTARTTTSVSRVGGKRFKRRNFGPHPRPNTAEDAKLERAIKSVKRKLNGPSVQDTFSLTLTLGTINGTDTDDLNRQMRYPLNPVLLKIDDSGLATTPLAERAHQYNLWKLLHCSVQLTPLVNASNITGTVAYVDLDEEGGGVKPETVDTIKAKLHAECFVGQKVIFTVAAKRLEGPRQTWWWVDTNEDSEESVGPALDFWTYLQTKNLLNVTNEAAKATTVPYTGPLWLVEMKVKYAFNNYTPKPALAVLNNEKVPATGLKFETGENGELIISGSAKARAFQNHRAVSKFKAVSKAIVGTENLSTAIYTFADDAMKTVAASLGPWGWLLKAGWFVIRQLLPSSEEFYDAGTFRAVVYPSIKAAQDHEPVIVNSLSQLNFSDINIPDTIIRLQQINAPNLNYNDQTSLYDTAQLADNNLAYPLVSWNRRERYLANPEHNRPNAIVSQSLVFEGPSRVMRIAKVQDNSNITIKTATWWAACTIQHWAKDAASGVAETKISLKQPVFDTWPDQNFAGICPIVRIWQLDDWNGLGKISLQSTSQAFRRSVLAGDLTSTCNVLKQTPYPEFNGFYRVKNFEGNGQTSWNFAIKTVSSASPAGTVWLSQLLEQMLKNNNWDPVLDNVNPKMPLWLAPVSTAEVMISNNGGTVGDMWLNGFVLLCPDLEQAVYFGYHRYFVKTSQIQGMCQFNTALFHNFDIQEWTQPWRKWNEEVTQPAQDDDDLDETDFSVVANYQSPERRASFSFSTEPSTLEELNYWKNLAKDLMLKNAQADLDGGARKTLFFYF